MADYLAEGELDWAIELSAYCVEPDDANLYRRAVDVAVHRGAHQLRGNTPVQDKQSNEMYRSVVVAGRPTSDAIRSTFNGCAIDPASSRNSRRTSLRRSTSANWVTFITAVDLALTTGALTSRGCGRMVAFNVGGLVGLLAEKWSPNRGPMGTDGTEGGRVLAA